MSFINEHTNAANAREWRRVKRVVARQQTAEECKAAAQEKRDRKNAKRLMDDATTCVGQANARYRLGAP